MGKGLQLLQRASYCNGKFVIAWMITKNKMQKFVFIINVKFFYSCGNL